jgi:hypothetical protein
MRIKIQPEIFGKNPEFLGKIPKGFAAPHASMTLLMNGNVLMQVAGFRLSGCLKLRQLLM